MNEISSASLVRGFDGAAALLGTRTASVLKKLPAELRSSASEISVGEAVSVECGVARQEIALPDGSDIQSVFMQLCRNSVYSFRDTIAQGYIPLPGGHRAGLCGTAVIENGKVTGMRDISRICIRIARQIPGAADGLKSYILGTRGALFSGAPCSGKTTLLRDTAYALASGRWGRRRRTVIIDSRGELAAVYNGTPQLDTGGCFILDGYPKAEGMLQAIRCLAPEYIICDEIGGSEEAAAVTQCTNTGAVVIASVHAGSASELLRRPQLAPLTESGAFDTLIQLKQGASPGTVEGIYSMNGITEDFENEMDMYADDPSLRVLCRKRTLHKIV